MKKFTKVLSVFIAVLFGAVMPMLKINACAETVPAQSCSVSGLSSDAAAKPAEIKISAKECFVKRLAKKIFKDIKSISQTVFVGGTAFIVCVLSLPVTWAVSTFYVISDILHN